MIANQHTAACRVYHQHAAEPAALTRDVTVTVVIDHHTGTVTVVANGRIVGAVPVFRPAHATTVEVCVFNARDWSHETWHTTSPTSGRPARTTGRGAS